MRNVLLGLSAVASLALVACGNDDGNTNNTNNTNNTTCAVEANFTSIHDNLLSNTLTCAVSGCHDSTAFGGLNFTTGKADVYRQLTEDPVMSTAASVTKRVDTTAANSFLYLRLTAAEIGPMPPTGVIPDCQQMAVKDWIDGGAAND